MKIHTPKLTNAQEMAKNHPDTFEAPTLEELDAVKVGDSVKVCINGNPNSERPWVEVLTRDEKVCTGRINNDLVLKDQHGLDYNDVIQFNLDNIYSIFSE